MERTFIGDLSIANSRVRVCGWVQEIRRLKNILFIILRDSTGLCQLTIKGDMIEPWMDQIQRESVLCAEGENIKDGISKAGREVSVTSLELLNGARSPLPLAPFDPVKADIETRLNNRFLDLRRKDHLAIFRIKSSLLYGIRKFLHSQNFIEVQTPKVVASATEGGADLFAVKYFESNAYLNQSPQLYKEILISAGFERVFEVGPAFRAEKHNTTRHLNEFTSVDIEMGFSDHNDAMAVLEQAVSAGITNVLAERSLDLMAVGKAISLQKTPFPRISFSECCDILSGQGQDHNVEEDFSPEELKIIGDRFEGFYFITGWPSSLRPFYTMPDQKDPQFTNSFDLQYREKEITSGAQRVHDPELLKERFLAKGLNPEDFDFYIKAFEYGMPPHAGWGLGLERLTMILLDLQNIRETSLFPRDRTRIKP